MQAKSTAALVLLGAALMMPASCASARKNLAPPPGVDLSGGWVLDQNASDSFDSEMSEPRGVVRRNPGSPGAAGGGRMIRRDDVRRDMASLADAPERMTLVQTDTSVSLRAAGSRRVAVVPITGRRTSVTWLDGEAVDVRAAWRDGDLRIERKREDASAVDLYSRSPGSDRLIITTTLSGGMSPDIKLRRVYDLEASTYIP